jgi:VIT1/CCC1 family predicted Fe2+/Mn2+ transporter
MTLFDERFVHTEHTWSNRIRTLLWSVAATVMGAFIVMLLYQSGLMDRAATISLTWLAAVIAVTAAIMAILGSTSTDAAP